MVLLNTIPRIAGRRTIKRKILHSFTCNYEGLRSALSPAQGDAYTLVFHRLSTNSTEVKQGDPNLKWKSWFESHEYQPIWSKHPFADSNPNQIQPLPYTILDNSSRLLLSQLDEIARNADVNKQIDVPTTKQCNTMIKRLGDFNEGGGELEGRSLRAYLIWKKMEYCVDTRQDLDENTQKFHYVLPRPDRETYLSVLTLHATDIECGEAGDAPKRALEIVKKMEERFRNGNWNAEPSRMIWNQVVDSWANSSHAEKSYEAANILKIHVGEKADASTFGHVFKACATTVGRHRSKELAGKVAVTVWAEFEKSNLMAMKDGDEDSQSHLFDRGSLMFVNALKAMQLLDDTRLRNKLINAQFQAACKLGLVNSHVLNALQSVASSEYLEKTLGKYGSTQAHVPRIFRKIPKSWKRNAKTDAKGW